MPLLERLIRIMLVPAAAILGGVLVGMVFLKLTGYPAIATFRAIYDGTLRDWYGFFQVLRQTSLLTFTGLSVALAFRAGLFNIGAEGQLVFGAAMLGFASVALKFVSKETAASIHWGLYLAAGMAICMTFSALWAMIPGLLKAFTGAHEVISTIMMNFIALALVNYLLRPGSLLASPGRMQTPTLPKSARAPKFSQLSEQWFPGFTGFEGSTLNIISLLAPLVAVMVYLLLWHTRFGFALRAVGKNSEAARAAGISPRKMIVITMAFSGALAGLAGMEFVLGHKGHFEEGFSSGIGFLGIAVALLANNHPIGILFTAFLFGVLNYSAVAIPTEFGKYISAGLLPESTLVPPKDIIDIMQAAIILSVILGNKIFDRLMLNMKKRSLASATESGQ